MFNADMERMLQRLTDRINDPRTPPRQRRYLEKLVDDALNARRNYDQHIETLEMQLLRNPAFAGDLIGYWEEDEREDTDDEDTTG